MKKGFLRGVLIGAIVSALVALYVWLKGHEVLSFTEHLSNALFQIGLILLIIGVIIFTRLVSYRRRLVLKNYYAMFTSKTREEYRQHVESEEELNEKDTKNFGERGRDISMLVAALVPILLSILLSLNGWQ